MTSIHSAAETRSYLPFMCLLLPFLAIHGALIVHDTYAPAAFIAADRAGSRLDKINEVIEASSLADSIDVVRALGAPGDYLIQAVIMGIGGRFGLIAFQILLQLAATAAVYLIGRHWLKSDRAAFWAAVVFILLPSSVYHPHVLSTESIANPLLLLAFVAGVLAVRSEQRFGWVLMLVGTLLGVVAFIRSQYVLLPPLIMLLMLAVPRFRNGKCVALMMLFFVGVPLLTASIGGDAPVGAASSHGLERNLYNRAERIAHIEGFAVVVYDSGNRTMSPSAFLRVASENPRAYARTIIGDAINAIANPGTSTVFGWYLGWVPREDDSKFWHRARDTGGISSLLNVIASHGATFVWLMAITLIVWCALLSLALIGVASKDVRRKIGRFDVALILLVLAYCYGIPLVSGAVRWTHRTASDFLLALLCVAGVMALNALWAKHRLHARAKLQRL